MFVPCLLQSSGLFSLYPSASCARTHSALGPFPSIPFPSSLCRLLFLIILIGRTMRSSVNYSSDLLGTRPITLLGIWVLFYFFLNESCNIYFRFSLGCVCVCVCVCVCFFFATQAICGNPWTSDRTEAAQQQPEPKQ